MIVILFVCRSNARSVSEHEAGVRQVEVVLEPGRQALEPPHRVV
jgi:hypothetical protein